ncbi:ABC transporter ATP-binding protein, partial [Bifidobacterium bifidum IPLA 20015]
AAAKLSWLDGGYAANGVAPADSSAPTAPFPSPEES